MSEREFVGELVVMGPGHTNPNVTMSTGPTLPTGAGYQVGATFYKTGLGAGKYENVGTTAAAVFAPVGNAPTSQFTFANAGRTLAVASAGATSQLATNPLATTADLAFANFAISNASEQVLTSIAALANSLTVVTSGNVAAATHTFDWLTIRPGGPKNYAVFAAGNATSVSGSTIAITVAGAKVSDIALVTLKTLGTGARTISKAILTAGTLTVTASGELAANHVVNYVILRPAGTFRPSHAIYAAGDAISVAGSATQTITVAGGLATDIAFAQMNTTDDADTLLTCAAAAGGITVVGSADPLAGHRYSYFTLRAL